VEESYLATELERLTALKNAGVASEADLKRLAELGNATATNDDDMEELGTVTNIEKFNASGEYKLNKEGFYKSKLMSVQYPATQKPQAWFIFETDDAKCPKPNRGVYVGEFGEGSGILRTLLDALALTYKLDEATGILKWNKPTLPLACYADWSRTDKAIGGVKISGLKTEAAGAAIKPTV
jgi:hypothetical protein